MSLQEPFTPVINRLWAILNADSDFVARVKPGNQIVWTGKPENAIEKRNVLQPSDAPEVEILPGTCPQDWALSSRVAEWTQTFSISIKSGDLRVFWLDHNGDPQGINVLAWIVYNALYSAGDTLGLNYISACRITAAAPLLLTSEQNRGKAGWTQLLTVHVNMVIPRVSDTLQFNPDELAPVIISPDCVGAARDEPFYYQITADNYPASFSATGLPDGLTLNSCTGLISGSPTLEGSFSVVMGATNEYGAGTLDVTLVVGGGGGMSPIVQDATPDLALYDYGQPWMTATSSPILYYVLTPQDGGGGKQWTMLAETGIPAP